MGGHVFLSYCRDDRDYVDKLTAYLEESGVPVWVDDHLVPGEQWLNALRRRIEEAEAVVVVMTPAAERSDWVQIEIQQARDAGRPILPLLLDGRPFQSLLSTQHLDVSGQQLPGPAFLSRLRSTPPAPPPGMPIRMAGIHPDQAPDVIDVRDDCARATTVLALIAQMLRLLLDDRGFRRALHGSAVVTIGAVKVVLPRHYGQRGRVRPLRVDDHVVRRFETAISQVGVALGRIGPDRAFPAARVLDAQGRLKPAASISAATRGGPDGLDARLGHALQATEQALTAARALNHEVCSVGVDVCGFDLSHLVVADLERLDGFRWDSTTRWPRKLVDAVFERSISAGDGTMLVCRPTG